MSYESETPFDNIEGSHEYVSLLAESIDEARREVESEIAIADRDKADRRKEALLLVSFNLAKLQLHFTNSRRILNDLRTLRRLLLAERRGLATEETATARNPSMSARYLRAGIKSTLGVTASGAQMLGWSAARSPAVSWSCRRNSCCGRPWYQ